MAYLTIEEANITALEDARETDPAVVVLSRFGEDILTLKAGITTETDAREVGRVYEVRDELWFALDPEYIRQTNAHLRAHQASDSALRAGGWNI